MSADPSPRLPLDAFVEPAALLEPGTLRVLAADRVLLERAPARIGGDEFAVLLPGLTDREAALLVELVRSAVAGDTAAIEAPVTISAGICTLASTPDGVVAGEIPDGAAILGVADAYDAMTVARPYSAPLPAGEALEECHRLAGVRFDPDAVTALEAVLAPGSGRRYPSRWGPSGS
jgi:HD domain-containing protein/diguanylate cyclase with GGDEF domain